MGEWINASAFNNIMYIEVKSSEPQLHTKICVDFKTWCQMEKQVPEEHMHMVLNDF